MSQLLLSTSHIDTYLRDHPVTPPVSLETAHQSLKNRTCPSADFLGWVDLPSQMTGQIGDIQKVVHELRESADVLIVCGIGGSYLGARALIEALWDTTSREVVFLGNHLSGREYERIFATYRGARVAACVISKSGTTLETAISYRLVRAFLLSKYSPEETQQRLVTITDETHGALRAETVQQGYTSFVLPADIGGRYSVLTAVGLLPCAFAGIDIQWLLVWAEMAQKEIQASQAKNHPAFLYVEKRVQLEQSGLVSEILVTMEPSLYFLGEWWKQLMGESHWKQGKGLYPDTLSYTTDLHSLGQYVQEGRRLFFETFLWIDTPTATMTVPAMEALQDGLDPLVGRTLHDLNRIALESTAQAHHDGGCPSMTITLPDLSPQSLGYWMYTMMYACALSGIMIGVDPFNQPGVEAYKSEMRKRM